MIINKKNKIKINGFVMQVYVIMLPNCEQVSVNK